MRALLFACLVLFALPAQAGDWMRYDNARFGYAVAVPPDFLWEPEADNGDGRVFRSPRGTQVLRVYGGNVLDPSFEDAVRSAMAGLRDQGWVLSYERVTPSWASYSGRRHGIILYARAIALCAGTQHASYEFEYPERDLRQVEPWIERLNTSLTATGQGLGC